MSKFIIHLLFSGVVSDLLKVRNGHTYRTLPPSFSRAIAQPLATRERTAEKESVRGGEGHFFVHQSNGAPVLVALFFQLSNPIFFLSWSSCCWLSTFSSLSHCTRVTDLSGEEIERQRQLFFSPTSPLSPLGWVIAIARMHAHIRVCCPLKKNYIPSHILSSFLHYLFCFWAICSYCFAKLLRHHDKPRIRSRSSRRGRLCRAPSSGWLVSCPRFSIRLSRHFAHSLSFLS